MSRTRGRCWLDFIQPAAPSRSTHLPSPQQFSLFFAHHIYATIIGQIN
ncbi:MAG TPA: hypothetical protein VN729_02655 [Ktedonobacteraceae bacterium]|nr:hypothetical protein [Ktedonobacteraceae bacterium]